LKIRLFVFTQFTNVTDTHAHTHRQTPHDGKNSHAKHTKPKAEHKPNQPAPVHL